MITVFTSSNSELRKTHSLSDEGKLVTIPSANASSGKLEIHDINTASKLEKLFKSLTPHQAIISGLFPYSTLTKENRRTKDKASIKNPWYKFDGDYNINCERLTIKILQQIDPQLANCRYLDLNSSSNIIIDSQNINAHKVGIWMQFKAESSEEITLYIENFFKRLIIAGYGEYILTKSERSYATYLRTVIDKTVFSPERISFEAAPLCNDGIEHNTRYLAHEGELIDPKKLKPLNAMDEALYLTKLKEIEEAMKPEVEAKKHLVKSKFPEDYQRQETIQTGNYITGSLISNDFKDIPNPAFSGSDDHVAFKSPMRDPLDPEYGVSKAKAWKNEDGSMYLHSFAHGSTTHRLLFPVIEALDKGLFDKWTSLTKVTRKQKGEVRQKLVELAPRMLWSTIDLRILSEELPLSLAVIESILRKYSVNLELIEAMKVAKSMEGTFKMLETGSAPMISLDPDTGIRSLSGTGFARVLDDPVLTGYLTSTAERVNGFGMYYKTPYKKLNLWGGFTVNKIADKIITDMDIAPFIYLVRLSTDEEYHKHINPSKEWKHTQWELSIPRNFDLSTFEFKNAKIPYNVGTNYLLDWFADLIQNPLRNEDLRTSIHIKGINRTGKSVLSFLIASFFSPYNRKEVHNWEQVFTRFNSFISHTVFIQAEEATFAHGLYNEFKSLTSSPYTDVELKGIDGTIQVPSCTRIFQTSNNDARREDLADTRTTVFTISAKHREDKIWFGKLMNWWNKEGGKEKVFTYLAQRKFNVNTITSSLQNRDTIEGKIMNLDSAQRYGLSMLNVDGIEEMGSATNLFNAFEIQYPNEKFYTAPNGLTRALRGLFKAVNGEEGFYKHNNKWHIDRELCKEVITGRLGCSWTELEPVLIYNDIIEKD